MNWLTLHRIVIAVNISFVLFSASCLIPAVDNAAGSRLYMNGTEVFSGSEVIHGSDVTLLCPKGHVADKATFTCKYGKLNMREVPRCVLGKQAEPHSYGSPLLS